MTREFIRKILNLYLGYTKATGPYARKEDNRQHIVLNNSTLAKGTKGKLKTISYPKAIMEVYLGRRLNKKDTVDHIDCNPLNNDINNLRILTLTEHVKLDAKRRKDISRPCVQCGKDILLTRSQLRKNSSGPFCSKRCSGIYGKQVQLGRLKLPSKQIEVEYYTLKSLE